MPAAVRAPSPMNKSPMPGMHSTSNNMAVKPNITHNSTVSRVNLTAILIFMVKVLGCRLHAILNTQLHQRLPEVC